MMTRHASRLIGLLALAAVVSAPARGQTTTTTTTTSRTTTTTRATTVAPFGAANLVVPQVARSFAMRPGERGVAVTAIDAQVEIIEQTARTTLQVTMRNLEPRQTEAVLLLPVPPGAAVSAFAFDGAASEPTAVLMAADEARRTYDQIVNAVRDPALLEFAGCNLVRSSVFPVPPGGMQRVRLTYEQVLAADGDRIDYVLPRSESLQVHVPWSIDVTLRSSQPIVTVYSPSHAVETRRRGSGDVHLRLGDATTQEPGSFILSWLMERSGAAASVLAAPDPLEGGGWFLLLAGGFNAHTGAPTHLKREVTVVLDRSGSMTGGKLEQATAAALQVIEGLEPGEAFNIIDYSTTVSAFATRAVHQGGDAIVEARRYLAAMRPGGGTNIHDALVEALRPAPRDGLLPIVLFLTDGLPTVGRTAETTIREVVASANPHGRRVFTFGVGHDVNAPLLDRIAETTRATSTYVSPGQDVEVTVAKLFRKLHGPVLADLQLTVLDEHGQPTTRGAVELSPDPLPDLYEGDHLVLLGRYRGEQPMTFEISGRSTHGRHTMSVGFDPAKATMRHAFVPRLWAARRIALLVDQVRQAGAAAPGVVPVTNRVMTMSDPRFVELTDEILRLSTRFGILTEYTSFLATEGTDLSDWSDLHAGCREYLEEGAVRTRSGTWAVSQSMNNSSQKAQSVRNYGNRYQSADLEPVQFDAVQQMCDLSFFNRGGRWIEGSLIAEQAPLDPQVVIELGSEAHRDLVDRLAAEGRAGVISLQGEIVLRDGGRTVLVRNRE